MYRRRQEVANIFFLTISTAAAVYISSALVISGGARPGRSRSNDTVTCWSYSAFSFCVQHSMYIVRMTNHSKEGVIELPWPIFAYASLDVEKFCDSGPTVVKCDQQRWSTICWPQSWTWVYFLKPNQTQSNPQKFLPDPTKPIMDSWKLSRLKII